MSRKSNINSKGKGWFENPARHSLAARGIKTTNITEAKAKKLTKNAENVDPEEWKKDMKTDTGKIAMEEMVEGVSEDMDDELVANGKIWEKAKDIGGKAKEKTRDYGSRTKEKAKEYGGRAKEKAVEKMGDLKEKTKEKLSDAKEKLKGKSNRKIGDIIEDMLRNNEKGAVDKNAGTGERKGKTSKVSKELADKVRKGKEVSAKNINITGKNSQKLSQHLSDLKHDLEVMKSKVEILKELKKEKLRYYKQEYNIDKKEAKEDYQQTKEGLTDEVELAREKNELKSERNMKKLYYKLQVASTEADYQYAKKMHKYLGKLYEDRKQLVQRLIG